MHLRSDQIGAHHHQIKLLAQMLSALLCSLVA
jgi:hypothetical protein